MKGAPKTSDRRSRTIRAKRLGIDTLQEAHLYLRKDCDIARSEGLSVHARVLVSAGTRSIVATLYQVTFDALACDEAGLSNMAWERLGLSEGDEVVIAHAPPVGSLSRLRSKVYGERLDGAAFQEIMGDVANGRYSDIQLSSFITACAARPLDYDEIVTLTQAMVDSGSRIDWKTHPIADKHCVGGLPGNRTTPIVVAVLASLGIFIPKTSSRAITSPSGTADTMETLAPVNLDIRAMRRVVERENGCIVWGGAAHLSPTDDILIRVERALDLDGEGQLVASILSKKIAAGSTHLVIDLPVGPTAKVRSAATAKALSRILIDIGASFGVTVKTIETDGTAPVGRGIGPALEARDVLAVLQGKADAPADLKDRALMLSAALLELVGTAAEGEGLALAAEALANGRAFAKFQRICEAQGGMREPPVAEHRHDVTASHAGRVARFDNRLLARVAKLAGAPDDKAAGLDLHVRVGDPVRRGQPLYTIHAMAPGELDYAMGFVRSNPRIVEFER